MPYYLLTKKSNDMKRLISFLSALLIVGYVLFLLFGCEKEDYTAGIILSEEPEVIINSLELDTSITPTIIAKDFNFPNMKEIGQGVSYTPLPIASANCGNVNIQMTDYYGIEIQSINNETVVFTITDNIWYWEYNACCQFAPSVCDIGFIIGQAE